MCQAVVVSTEKRPLMARIAQTLEVSLDYFAGLSDLDSLSHIREESLWSHRCLPSPSWTGLCP